MWKNGGVITIGNAIMAQLPRWVKIVSEIVSKHLRFYKIFFFNFHKFELRILQLKISWKHSSIAPSGDILPHCKLCLPKCARKSSQAATVVVEGVHILQLPFSHSLKGLLCPFFPPPQWLQMVKIRHKIGLLWFHELFQGIVSRFTSFPFPVMECVSEQRFVKLLQA